VSINAFLKGKYYNKIKGLGISNFITLPDFFSNGITLTH